MIYAAAVASLEPKHRKLLGLRTPHIGPLPLPVKVPVKLVLGVIRFGLGSQGPSERSARERIARLTAQDVRDG